MTQRAFILAYTGIILAVSGTIAVRSGIIRPQISGTEISQSAEKVQEKVHVAYLLPQDMIRTLKANPLFPASVQMSLEADTNAVLMVGSHSDIVRAKELLKKMDVAPRQVLLKMRILRVAFNTSGQRSEEILQAPILLTIDNVKAYVNMTDAAGKQGTKVTALPHLLPNNTLELSATLAIQDKSAHLANEKRVIPLGKAIMFTGFTEKWGKPSPDPKTVRNVGLGMIPANVKNYVGSFLEVTATEYTAKQGATP